MEIPVAIAAFALIGMGVVLLVLIRGIAGIMEDIYG